MHIGPSASVSFALAEVDSCGVIIWANDKFILWTGRRRSCTVGAGIAIALDLNHDEIMTELNRADGVASFVMRRNTHGATPRLLIASISSMANGNRIAAFFDADRHQQTEQAFIAAQVLAETERHRLALLLDAAVSYSNVTAEAELCELLAESVCAAFTGTSASVHLIRDGVFACVGGNNPFEFVWPPGAPPQGARTMKDGRVLTLSSPAEIEDSIPNVDLPAIFDQVGVRAAIISPISDHGKPFGTVACWFDHDREFDDQAEAIITALAQHAGSVLSRLSAEEQLRISSMLDETTGLPTRRLFELQLERRAGSPARSISLLFIDLDGFKVVNDKLGHAAGDSVLAEVANRIRQVQRTQDAVARYGGDEFIAYFEFVDVNEADVFAERIRETLAESYESLPADITLSASIGVATSTGTDSTVEQLIRCADRAMYAAKERGGNLVVNHRDI